MNKLIPIEHKSQRVLTTAQVAEGYGCEPIKILQNFSNNKDRYFAGKHYFVVEGEELSSLKNRLENFEAVGSRASKVFLWTEKGCLLHAKSLNTDRAWEIYQELVDTYFRTAHVDPIKSLSKELQAILLHDRQIQEVTSRVAKLENTMTIDYGQQNKINMAARKAVVDALGGKGSPAYKLFGKTLFSEFWHRYQSTFAIGSYKDTPAIEYNNAIYWISNWQPETKTKYSIVGANTECAVVAVEQ